MLRSIYPPLICFCVSVLGVFVCEHTDTSFSLIFLFSALIFLVDTRGRVKDYIFLREKPAEYFKDERILGRFGRSWCGRTVLSGVYPQARPFYRSIGYRWYHVLPDKAFTKVSPFLRCSFWWNLFKGHRR